MRIALVQMTSGTQVSLNNDTINHALEEVINKNVDMIFLPEMCNIMQKNRSLLSHQLSLESEDSTLALLQDTAYRHQTWIHVGSLALLDEINSSPPFVNRSFIIDNQGEIVARYNKIHLFDVTLPDGEHHQESDTYARGNQGVVAATPFGVIGMSVCYDLRFPYLYTALVQSGARLLAIPAAFTQQTGRAHWETLLRARAIENASFVIAPAQCGDHADGRHTFGNSMVVGPWGDIIAKAGVAPETLITDIDLNQCDDVRNAIPVLKHQRTIDMSSLRILPHPAKENPL